MPLAWALVFGALISPTDPVAVLATLKNVDVPEALEIEMQGEALFNDGIGIVLFTVLVAFASGKGSEATSAGGVATLLLHEAGGGVLLGIVTGYIAYRAMKAIDDFPVEVLITLALVTGTYAIAQKLGASGPLAVVAAGLLIGERAPRYAMSDTTQKYVSALWTLVDEVLNSVLFLLIGLEVLVLRFQVAGLALAACAAPIVLFRPPRRGLDTGPAVPLGRQPLARQRAVPDLGGRARRHLGGAGPLDAGKRCQAGHPGGDLCSGAVHHRRTGSTLASWRDVPFERTRRSSDASRWIRARDGPSTGRWRDVGERFDTSARMGRPPESGPAVIHPSRDTHAGPPITEAGRKQSVCSDKVISENRTSLQQRLPGLLATGQAV